MTFLMRSYVLMNSEHKNVVLEINFVVVCVMLYNVIKGQIWSIWISKSWSLCKKGYAIIAIRPKLQVLIFQIDLTILIKFGLNVDSKKKLVLELSDRKLKIKHGGRLKFESLKIGANDCGVKFDYKKKQVKLRCLWFILHFLPLISQLYFVVFRWGPFCLSSER